MLTPTIHFTEFKIKKKKKKIKNELKIILKENTQLIRSLTKNIKINLTKKISQNIRNSEILE